LRRILLKQGIPEPPEIREDHETHLYADRTPEHNAYDDAMMWLDDAIHKPSYGPQGKRSFLETDAPSTHLRKWIKEAKERYDTMLQKYKDREEYERKNPIK
jgi:glutathione synthase/RimK-type ligase-like ATP-grasp enzyme